MRRLLNMPPQLLRIFLLAVGIVTTYMIARYFLTPTSFGQYGWYRGNALAEVAARQPVYAGKKACEECHSDIYVKLNKHEHKTLACEGCHGPGEAHAQDPRKDNIDKSGFAACLRCHEANPSRPKFQKQIVLKTHYSSPNTGPKCTECHVPHMPLEVP
jgi:hypothetical protein